MSQAVAVFLTAAIVGLAVSWPVLMLLRRMNSRQTVSQYAPEGHLRKQGTPTMGGFIILIAVAVALVPRSGPFQLEMLLLAGFGMIGFIDDYLWPKLKPGQRGLSWKPKLLLQLAASYIPLWGMGYGWAQTFAMALLIVAFANAFNFADGLDGLAGGLLVILGLTFAVMGGQQSWGLVGAACAGGACAFLFWNAPPAKVFMGDVGSLPLGALLGSMTIQALFSMDPPGTATWVPLAVLSAVLIAELIPVPLQILAVKTVGRRIFPATPIHHGFEVKGWPESRIVWTFLLVQLLLSAAAIRICAPVVKVS
jgi:phospho-N-acetylmuramoyl-pentapeptide-transferase